MDDDARSILPWDADYEKIISDLTGMRTIR